MTTKDLGAATAEVIARLTSYGFTVAEIGVVIMTTFSIVASRMPEEGRTQYVEENFKVLRQMLERGPANQP